MEDHVDPNLLFLGTELGIFFSGNRGESWSQMQGGIPTIPVRDLEIQEREHDLVAATFGRGFYILDDYSPLREYTQSNQAKEAHLFPIKDSWIYIPSNPIGGGKGSFGDAYYTAPNPPYGTVITYHIGDSPRSKRQNRMALERERLLQENKLLFRTGSISGTKISKSSVRLHRDQRRSK